MARGPPAGPQRARARLPRRQPSALAGGADRPPPPHPPRLREPVRRAGRDHRGRDRRALPGPRGGSPARHGGLPRARRQCDHLPRRRSRAQPRAGAPRARPARHRAGGERGEAGDAGVAGPRRLARARRLGARRPAERRRAPGGHGGPRRRGAHLEHGRRAPALRRGRAPGPMGARREPLARRRPRRIDGRRRRRRGLGRGDRRQAASSCGSSATTPPPWTFSPDGRRVIVPVLDGTVRVLDAAGGGPAKVLRGHTRPGWAARFSPDGSRAVSAGDDRTARVWDLGTGAATVLPHPAVVNSADFSPDGRLVATAAADGIVRIWDARSGRRRVSIRTDEQEVASVRFDEDGSRLVTAGEDGAVRLWSVLGGPPLEEMRATAVRSCRPPSCPGPTWWSAAARTGCCACGRRPPPRSPGARSPGASFAPDGRRVVSGGEDGAVRVWDTATGSLTELPVNQGLQRRRVLPRRRAGDQRAATTAPCGSPTRGGGTSRVVVHRRGPVFAATLDPAGERIAIARGGPEIEISSGSTAAAGVTLRGHRGVVRDVAFSPDGQARWPAHPTTPPCACGTRTRDGSSARSAGTASR